MTLFENGNLHSVLEIHYYLKYLPSKNTTEGYKEQKIQTISLNFTTNLNYFYCGRSENENYLINFE